MADVEFKDNRIEVKRAIEGAMAAFLFEASGELVSQAARNSRVDTGHLKGSWQANINEGAGEAVIGSNDENAIWEEFGTGVFAEKGNGRKTPWTYKDAGGNWHRTTGKTANHTLQKAFDSCKGKIQKRAQEVFRARFGG